MKLSKIYSNQKQQFPTIVFNPGLNVVIAETKEPKDKNKHTHNLGKTTLCRLIDFCMMNQRDEPWSLINFEDFVFYLEILLNDNTYMTIMREAKAKGKVSLKYSSSPIDCLGLLDAEWDQLNISDPIAKEIIDGKLNLIAQKGFPYRKGLSYFLRTQNEYQDLFRIVQKGKDKEWKPYLAYIMGYNYKLFIDSYTLKENIEKLKKEKKEKKNEIIGDASDLKSKIILNKKELDKFKNDQQGLNFEEQDKNDIETLVNCLDKKIVELNKEKYSLESSHERIQSSLQFDELHFETQKVVQLFEECGVLFPEQLKNGYNDLIAFNRQITQERISYLENDLLEIEKRLIDIGKELNKNNQERSEYIQHLNETNIFVKYRQLSDKIARKEAILIDLERQSEAYIEYLRIQNKLTEEKSKLAIIQNQIEEEISKPSKGNLFEKISIEFDSIVKKILNIQAVINVSLNGEKNIEFTEKLLDNEGRETNQDEGHTYKKFLCMSFDLALVYVHLPNSFFRMVFHDGPFEALDDRMKINFVDLMRHYENEGIQQIITLIDSDLPPQPGVKQLFDKNEIILRLNDTGADGRLFKMPSW